MFCADLGQASKVIGVDMSETIYFAIDIVNENGLQDKISLLKGFLIYILSVLMTFLSFDILSIASLTPL
jgi:hypothetical protein